MPHFIRPFVFLLALWPAMSFSAEVVPDVVLAIHGGTAGARPADSARVCESRADMEQALSAGYAALQQKDGTSLDAVEAAVRVLEDSPHFNAGKGAVFSHEGKNELDASIMEGRTRQGGAVAGVRVVKNPIRAARAVMEHSSHVLLSGRGAEIFATQQGLEIVDSSYFWTERRWGQIQKLWKSEAETGKTGAVETDVKSDYEWGTVGAVAIDRDGNLAAATSTGGLTGKRFGRVGDSPILGAGTYADNEACAVSGTGEGEYFIRLAIAHEIAVLMKYKNLPLESAASEAIEQLTSANGSGGVIALDKAGNFAAPFNTPGMHRGYVTRTGEVKVLLHDE